MKLKESLGIGGLWLTLLLGAGTFSIKEAPRPTIETTATLKPVMTFPVVSQKKTLVVLISGDGGWSSLDQEISHSFADQRFPVVGVDAVRFFWNLRTPEDAAREMEKLVKHYLSTWKLKQTLWVGQGVGADALPFLANRVSRSLQKKIRGLVLMGSSQSASNQFQETHWLTRVNIQGAQGQGTLKSELDSLKIATVCVRGNNEPQSCLKLSDNKNLKSIRLSDSSDTADARFDRVVASILKSF
jgi:type IV secretory pathway VirJ component